MTHDNGNVKKNRITLHSSATVVCHPNFGGSSGDRGGEAGKVGRIKNPESFRIFATIRELDPAPVARYPSSVTRNFYKLQP
jgi:hypothetical protein